VPIRKFTAEKHTVRADWLEPAWGSAGKPGRVRLVWMDFYRGSQTRRVLWQRHPGWFYPGAVVGEVAPSPARRTTTGLMPTFLLRSLRGIAVAPAGHLGWSVEGPQRQVGKPKSQMPRHTSPQGIPASLLSGKLLSLAPLLRNGLLNLAGPHICHRPGGHCKPPAYN
jgi:hypothetical protein